MKTNKTLYIYIFVILFGFVKSSFSQDCQWSVQGGGTNTDIISSLCLDHYGNQYVFGTTLSTVCYFITDTLYLKGKSDIFLIKYSKDGQETWIKQLGSSSEQDGESSGEIVFDLNNNRIILCGTFINKLELEDTTLYGYGYTGFILSIDPDGHIIWARAVENENPVWGNIRFFGITTDGVGNIYLSGCNRDPITLGGILVPAGGFLAKYNKDGQILWAKNKFRYHSTLPPSPSYPYCEAPPENIKFAHDELYVNGFTLNDTIVIDTISVVLGSNIVMYLAVFNPEGELTRFTCSGGPRCYSGNQIDLNSQGEVFLTGAFETEKGIFGNDTLQSHTTHGECYISKIDSSGEFLWTQQMFSTGSASCTGIILDISGDIYISGWFFGTIRCSENILVSGSNSDLFLAKFSKDGQCIGIRHYGQGLVPELAIDQWENLYLAGRFENTFEIGPHIFTSRGMEDVFAAKCAPITGIPQPLESPQEELMIYANPTTGQCNITIPEPFRQEKELRLQIYDQTGKLVQEARMELAGESIKLDIRAQAKGLYLAILTNGKRSYSGKIVFE